MKRASPLMVGIAFVALLVVACDDGLVTPSVDCTECEFHESGLVLEGWAA